MRLFIRASKPKHTNKKSTKILGSIYYAAFLAIIVEFYLCMFQIIEGHILPISVGIFFFISGFFIIKSNVGAALIFIIFGGALAISTILYKWGHIFGITIIWEKVASTLIGIGFILFGILFEVGVNSDFAKRKKRCTLNLEARCIDLLKKGRALYAPVYEYYYNGKCYKEISNIWGNIDMPEIDSIKEIWVNPNDLKDIYVPLTKIQRIFGNVLTFGVILSGIVILYFVLKG